MTHRHTNSFYLTACRVEPRARPKYEVEAGQAGGRLSVAPEDLRWYFPSRPPWHVFREVPISCADSEEEAPSDSEEEEEEDDMVIESEVVRDVKRNKREPKKPEPDTAPTDATPAVEKPDKRVRASFTTALYYAIKKQTEGKKKMVYALWSGD